MPRTLKLESWQGPPHLNKVKQSEIVLSLKVSLSIQLTQSFKTKKVCLFSLSRHKNQSRQIFLFRLKCIPRNYIVHL